MTTPEERTRAVISVRNFLTKLLSAKHGYKRIPKEVRKEAHRLLKHYPLGIDLIGKDSFDKDVIHGYYSTQFGTNPKEITK